MTAATERAHNGCFWASAVFGVGRGRADLAAISPAMRKVDHNHSGHVTALFAVMDRSGRIDPYRQRQITRRAWSNAPVAESTKKTVAQHF
ncbi:hypothetical protein [Mycolicibacterium fortuitum]|uniref:hypothetical protein n=1 Tax=Mycolicibacterium fortuitum TaxID=1766 RepID=UPI000AD5839A|nr:hypothetical protein [Mycolicibacterium fortuitum]MDG5772689.1 hypothetical protein [Mycolicibacterium fortuitum]MDG5783738.1 hypothetical protein [Mycolicibacterium fortuitum]